MIIFIMVYYTNCFLHFLIDWDKTHGPVTEEGKYSLRFKIYLYINVDQTQRDMIVSLQSDPVIMCLVICNSNDIKVKLH